MEKKRNIKINEGKLPPQHIVLEEAVLGAIMLENYLLNNIAEFFTPDIFYKEKHQIIATAIIKLHSQRKEVDINSVVSELRRTGELDTVGGAYSIVTLTNSVANTQSTLQNVLMIVESFIKREAIRTSNEEIEMAYVDGTDIFDLIDFKEKNTTKLSSKVIVGKTTTIQQLFEKSTTRNQEILKNKDGYSGTPSGFPAIDRITGGWQKSDLIILAARPAMGKTSLMLNYASNAAIQFNKAVAIFSLEMSEIQLMARLQSQQSGIPLSHYLRDGLGDYEERQNHSSCQGLINSKIYIDDSSALSLFEFRNKARKLKREKKIDIIFIDYLQLMSCGEKAFSKEDAISKISSGIKAIAKELNVPIVALSQLSRAVEGRGGNKVPQLSDLRDSGAIEQDADMVQFIYRAEYYGVMADEKGNSTAGQATVIIAKHRNGATDYINIEFDGTTTNFNNGTQTQVTELMSNNNFLSTKEDEPF